MAPRHDKYQGLERHKNGKWGIDCYLNGRRVRRQVGTEAQARALLRELKARQLVGEPVTPPPTRFGPRMASRASQIAAAAPDPQNTMNGRPTMAVVFQNYGKILKEGSADRVYADKWVEAIGTWLPEQVTILALREFVGARLKKRAPATVSRQLDVLHAAWKDGQETGTIDRNLPNPVANKRRLGLDSLNNEREVHVSFEQEQKLAYSLGEHFCYYLFGVFSPIRQGNQIAMEWTWIDFAAGRVTVPRTKNGKKHVVTLSPQALQILKDQRERFPHSKHCFPRLDGAPFNKDSFYKIWRPAFDAAGLAHAVWHDLRHTAATRLAESGFDLYVIMQTLGHRDYRSAQRYTHLTDSTRAAAAACLASWREERDIEDRQRRNAVVLAKIAEKKKAAASE